MKPEKTHPYEGGFFRRKYRRDRRSGMALEDPLTFYSRHAWETAYKYARALCMAWRYHRLARRVEKDTAEYTDLGLTPVPLDEMSDLEMFTVSSAAQVTLHTLALDKDFGYGYVYPLIVEDASVTKA